MSATHARDTMSASNDLAWRRPFLSLISRGRCFGPAVRPSHLSNAPFASISAPSQPTDGDDIRRGDTSTSAASSDYSSPRVSSSHDSPGEERFTSLVHLESEPLITVIFPQWMVEVYQEFVMFGSACKRLFLPENSIKSKLPYYREAVSNPGTTVVMNPKLENLMDSYRKYGRNGRFVTSSTVDRSRGLRFDMPSPGMKTITAVEIILTWWLATIYV